MSEKKKKVVIHSNFCLANTGFGRHCKLLLSYLYKTGKYDLVEYAAAPITWSHPICKTMPWKCYGAWPDNEQELIPFQHDPNILTAIKYGEKYINRVLEIEKPDAIIMIEDIWGIQHFNKPWIGKLAHVFWTPIDSLPLFPLFKENKDKFGNLWVKAKFAQKALAEQGVESKFMPALIDNKDFKILSQDEKDNIRKKYGIAKDTLIFGFVFRNQLRKLVGTLIEAFALFKKENPTVDAKLFLHTCWTDQGGWRIWEFIDRYGVKKEDVLTTHICNKCLDISVKPYFGEESPCKKCGAEKSVNTISVDIGVTEEQLCELYNMCDAYIHPATSGGFEMPMLESMLCGLPSATTDYSYGKDFTENENVYPLKYCMSSEVGSHFDKANVYPESIVDFMNKILSMSKEQRQKVGQELRDWALSIYDPNVVCKQIEQFLDDVPFTDFDFNFSSEKNENYPMPDIENNQDFVIDLYANILKMDVKGNPSEINNALSLFAAGQTQQQVYEKFIEVAKSQNQSQKKVKLEDLLDQESGKKKLLYVEPDGYGDCLDSLIVLDNLTKKYPVEEYDYYIATLLPEAFDHLTFIKKIIPYDQFLDDILGMEGIGDHLGFFDVAFHPKLTRSSADFYKNNLV